MKQVPEAPPSPKWSELPCWLRQESLLTMRRLQIRPPALISTTAPSTGVEGAPRIRTPIQRLAPRRSVGRRAAGAGVPLPRSGPAARLGVPVHPGSDLFRILSGPGQLEKGQAREGGAGQEEGRETGADQGAGGPASMGTSTSRGLSGAPSFQPPGRVRIPVRRLVAAGENSSPCISISQPLARGRAR